MFARKETAINSTVAPPKGRHALSSSLKNSSRRKTMLQASADHKLTGSARKSTSCGASLQTEVPGVAFLEPRDVFFTNLILLGFDCVQFEDTYKIPFNKNIFDQSNRKAMEIIVHFLFTKLNSNKAKLMFKNCWPIYDKKQEQQFRKTSVQWLGEIAREDPSSRVPPIAASLLLTPGGSRFCQFMEVFSSHVLKIYAAKLAGSLNFVPKFNFEKTSANKSTGELVSCAIQLHIVACQQRFLKLMEEWSLLNERLQSSASAGVKEYRDLSKQLRELDKEQQSLGETLKSAALKRLDLDASAVRDPETVKMAAIETVEKQRIERMEKVEKNWRTLEGFLKETEVQKCVMDSVLSGKEKQYQLDSKELSFKIPEQLVKDERKLQKVLCGENTYEEGQLNLLSLVRLWKYSLTEIRDELQKGYDATPEEVRDSCEYFKRNVAEHDKHSMTASTMLSELSDLSEKLSSYIETVQNQLITSHKYIPSGRDLQAFGLTLFPPSPKKGKPLQLVQQFHPLSLPETKESEEEAIERVRNSIMSASLQKTAQSPLKGNPLAFLDGLLHPHTTKLPVRKKDEEGSRHVQQDTSSLQNPAGPVTRTSLVTRKRDHKRIQNTKAKHRSYNLTHSLTVDKSSILSPFSSPLSSVPTTFASSLLTWQIADTAQNRTSPQHPQARATPSVTSPQHPQARATPTVTSPQYPQVRATPTVTSPQYPQVRATPPTLVGMAPYEILKPVAAQEILAEEIASDVAQGDLSPLLGSAGSSRTEAPGVTHLHCITDPVAALQTDSEAFVTRDKLARTPPYRGDQTVVNDATLSVSHPPRHSHERARLTKVTPSQSPLSVTHTLSQPAGSFVEARKLNLEETSLQSSSFLVEDRNIFLQRSQSDLSAENRPTSYSSHQASPTLHPASHSSHQASPTLHPASHSSHQSSPTLHPASHSSHQASPTLHPTSHSSHQVSPTLHPASHSSPTLHPTSAAELVKEVQSFPQPSPSAIPQCRDVASDVSTITDTSGTDSDSVTQTFPNTDILSNMVADLELNDDNGSVSPEMIPDDFLLPSDPPTPFREASLLEDSPANQKNQSHSHSTSEVSFTSLISSLHEDSSQLGTVPNNNTTLLDLPNDPAGASDILGYFQCLRPLTSPQRESVPNLISFTPVATSSSRVSAGADTSKSFSGKTLVYTTLKQKGVAATRKDIFSESLPSNLSIPLT